MHDANADLVRELRVPSDADDQAIQEALIKLFNAQVQDQKQSETVVKEGQAIRAKRSSPQGTDQALKAQTEQALKASVSDKIQSSSDSVRESKPSSSDSVQFKPVVPVSSSSNQDSHCTIAVARSSVKIDNSLRDRMYSLLTKEILYGDIIEEIESTGRNEIVRGQEKYRIQKKCLMIHITGQPEDVQYWRMVVPDDVDVKTLLVSELHNVPYAAHPGVQRTIGMVRRYFWWKGMVGDIREHVETCPTCQLEKTNHTMKKGSLQSLAIPEAKWQEVSVDFITDLPTAVGGEDSIMTVVDRATKMVHLIPCQKTTMWEFLYFRLGVP